MLDHDLEVLVVLGLLELGREQVVIEAEGVERGGLLLATPGLPVLPQLPKLMLELLVVHLGVRHPQNPVSLVLLPRGRVVNYRFRFRLSTDLLHVRVGGRGNQAPAVLVALVELQTRLGFIGGALRHRRHGSILDGVAQGPSGTHYAYSVNGRKQPVNDGLMQSVVVYHRILIAVISRGDVVSQRNVVECRRLLQLPQIKCLVQVVSEFE